MYPNGGDYSVVILMIVGAVIAALVVIGILTDGFGLYSWEMEPGITTPLNNPS